MKNRYLEHALVMLGKAENLAILEFKGLDNLCLNWKPQPKSWSIAECLDHLVRTNNAYFERFEAIKNHTLDRPIMASFPGWASFCSRQILRSVDPEHTKPVKTFRVFAPAASHYPDSVVDDYITSLLRLKTYLHELDGYENHAGIRLASPVSKWVVLDLESAVNILWKHCIRHTNQAIRVKATPGFPFSDR